jgi:hypothetical protein
MAYVHNDREASFAMANTIQIQRTIKEIDSLLSSHTKIRAEADSQERNKLTSALDDAAKVLDKALASFKELPSHNGNDGNWEKLVSAMGKYRQAKSLLMDFDTPQSEKDLDKAEREALLNRAQPGKEDVTRRGVERRKGQRRTSGSALVARMTVLSNEVMAESHDDVFSNIAYLVKKGKEKYFPPRMIKILKLQLEEASDHLDAMIRDFKKSSGDKVLSDVVVALDDYQKAAASYAMAVKQQKAKQTAPAASKARPGKSVFESLLKEKTPESLMKSIDLSSERSSRIEARLEQTYQYILKTGKLPV